MKKVCITGTNLLLPIITRDDILNHAEELVKDPFINECYEGLDIIEICSEVFKVVGSVCSRLHVPYPDITFTDTIACISIYDGSLTEKSAMTYLKKDHPELENDVIQIALKHLEPLYISGVIAHEIRHLYQNIYDPDINAEYAQSYTDSLRHPAEIDADAFAIWYLAGGAHISYEAAADIICPVEKEHDPEFFHKRIEAATKIPKELSDFEGSFESHNGSEKLTFFDKIKRFFRNLFAA